MHTERWETGIFILLVVFFSLCCSFSSLSLYPLGSLSKRYRMFCSNITMEKTARMPGGAKSLGCFSADNLWAIVYTWDGN